MKSLLYVKGSDGTGNASMATVQTVRSPGASTILVNTVSGIPAKFYGSMGAPHTFTDPVTGETITVISEATAVDFAGHVDSGHLEIDAIAPGALDTRGSLVGDIIVIRPVTEWANNLYNFLNEAHDDDGTLKANVVTTAKILDANVTTAKIADSAVTFAKIDTANFVSFRAYRTTTQTVSANTTTTVAFNSVIKNVGSAYDSSTGLFTAPATGTYFFTFGLYCEGAAMSRGFYFYRGTATFINRGGDRSFDLAGATGGMSRHSGMAEVEMTAGQTFGLSAYVTTTANIADANGATFFTGRRVI